MILDEILRHKREEVANSRKSTPLDELRRIIADSPPPEDFYGAVASGADVTIIAEIKHRSPSAGLIRKDFDIGQIARAYHIGGASAISVLTDKKYFGGELGFIAAAKAASALPALRKDFIIDEYQLFEARAALADAVLLIVRVLSNEQLREYLALAGELGMAALVETHDAAELEQAIAAGAPIIGINNRDLDTLRVDLMTTEVLARNVPEGRIVVSESGIVERRDVEHMALHGAHAVLVGEHLLKSVDIARATADLTGVPRTPFIRPEAQNR